MWLRNESGYYVCELRGVCYVTWVSERDASRAAYFPADRIEDWVNLLSEMTGEKLEAVKPFLRDHATEGRP